MASLSTLVKVLEGEIGYREKGTNDTKYNRWLGKISGYPHNGYGYPWCASFASWAYAQAGLKAGEDFPRTASCAVGVSWYKARGRWSSTPKPGAQVYYGPNGGTHTEIVVAVDSKYITTIGGNTGGSLNGTYYNGDGVYRKKIARSESRIYGYGMPRNLDASDVTEFTPDDIKAIARAVWETDGIIDAPPWKVAEGNTHWTPKSYLYWAYRQGADTKDAVKSLRPADPATLAAAVLSELSPQVIAASVPAAVASAVLTELRKRLGKEVA